MTLLRGVQRLAQRVPAAPDAAQYVDELDGDAPARRRGRGGIENKQTLILLQQALDRR